MESKRGHGGWWALIGIGMLALLTLYVGTYYALVFAADDLQVDSTSSGPIPLVPAYGPLRLWRYDRFLQPLFRPIHQIDRMIRPSYWTDP